MAEEKAILIDLGTVRVREYDKWNVVVERLEEGTNPITKEVVNTWKFKGYSDTILNALKSIVKNEWLIEKSVVKGLENYLKRIEESNNKILQAMK